MEKVLIIKGNIADFNYWGNNRLIRRGSFHFLPNQEIFVNNNRTNSYDLKYDNKISVIGQHKCGWNRHKKLHLKYLRGLRIEEILNPSVKTLEFIKDARIFCFQYNTFGFNFAEELIEQSKNLEKQNVAEQEISDPYFKAAKVFVQGLKRAIKDDDQEFIHSKLLDSNIEIMPISGKGEKKIISSDDFMKTYKSYFSLEVKDRILGTDLDSLFPTDKKLIVGNLEILINSKLEFKINKIYNKKNTAPNKA